MKFLNNLDVQGYITQSNAQNTMLKADASGKLVPAIAGVDYLLSAGGGSTNKIQHEVKLGEPMTIGTPVYIPISQDSSTNMVVMKASNSSEGTSSKTLGLIAGSGVTGDFVDVVTEGLLEGLNTSTASKGDPVWLGSNGTLIFGLANKPTAPNHLVFIGVVTRSNAINGEIFVKVQNGFETDELHDVIVTGRTSGNVMYWDGSINRYASIASVLGYTPYNATNPNGYISGINSSMVTSALGYTPYNATNPAGYITGITSSMVTNALGYTPYNSTNPNGYITSSSLTWANISGRPTALSQFTNDSGYITSSSLSPYLLKSGGTMGGTLTLASISGTDQMVENSYGAYLHLGGWGVGRTDASAVLVNTAYRADYADSLFDMNISRFTNNSGYQTSSGSVSYASSAGNADTVDGWHRDDLRAWGNHTGIPGNLTYWNSWYGSAYLGSDGNLYMGWLGRWLSETFNQDLRTSANPTFGNIYSNGWFRNYGYQGLYNQDYGCHFRANGSSSYGSWEIFGYYKNGYGGLLIHDPQGYYNNMMFENGNGGHYQQNGAGWGWYYNRGNDSFCASDSTTSPSYRFISPGHANIQGDLAVNGFTGLGSIQIGGTHYWNGNEGYNWRDWGGWGGYWFNRNGGDMIMNLYALYAVTGGISDIRYKKDIEALPYGLKEVLQLNPIKYHYNLPKESMLANDPDYFLGFSAQEVQGVIPEAVHEKIEEDSESMKGMLAITYNELIPVAFQAIKDQQVIIQNQDIKIKKLESLVNQLINKHGI